MTVINSIMPGQSGYLVAIVFPDNEIHPSVSTCQGASGLRPSCIRLWIVDLDFNLPGFRVR